MVSALVFLANGTEEMEFTIVVDVLRRANIEVTVAGIDLNGGHAVCSRGLKVVPDIPFENIQENDWTKYDAAVVPDGLKGAETCRDHPRVQQLLKQLDKENKWVAFICAGTIAAKAAGIGKGRSATSYPAFKEELADFYNYSEDRVVTDGNLVTSRGPGTSFLFALTLVSRLVSVEMSSHLKKEMLTTAEL
ncbi:class I glutamine amidotransferase-like protein [Chlamydoabsidia padenii]|nr:class I glutamine amidotransferase-like protein [Chlamydoabsidia padenii]